MYNEGRCLYGAVYYVLGSCKAFRSLLKENAFVAGVTPCRIFDYERIYYVGVLNV
jgi:hypothetical protein